MIIHALDGDSETPIPSIVKGKTRDYLIKPGEHTIEVSYHFQVTRFKMKETITIGPQVFNLNLESSSEYALKYDYIEKEIIIEKLN